ncbi:MAG TPA: alpha/beta fold hydrolase [Candidatus Polarisedimenticolia bacterium]|jgi:acetyl esterase/lipase
MHAIRYGPSADQEADLHLPATPRPPVVCLLHGGFWRTPHGRDQMTAIADDLACRGLAVWNLEYRRLGTPRAEWPATMDDVAAGIDHLAQLSVQGVDLDLDRVTVIGHSAGGQLALWIAGQNRSRSAQSPRVRVLAAVGLAPIADLAHAYEIKTGGEAVAELIGGTPSQQPERCRATSPIEMLPLRVRQLILHGTADDVVPIDLSRRYLRAAEAAGDTVELIELSGTGHMEYLDPGSEAHATLCRWLLASTSERTIDEPRYS